MSARVLVQTAPFAFKVAPAGIDAETAADDQLLMSLTNVPASIIMAGSLYVTTAAPVAVDFPFAMSVIPIVDIQTMLTNGEVRIPYFRTGGGYARVLVAVTLTGMTFSVVDTDRYINYLVMAKQGG